MIVAVWLVIQFGVCFAGSFYGERSAHRAAQRRRSKPTPLYDRLFWPVAGFVVLVIVAFTVDSLVGRLVWIAAVLGGVAGDAYSMRRRRTAEARVAERRSA